MVGMKRKKNASKKSSGKDRNFMNDAISNMQSNEEKKEQIRKRMRIVQLQRALDRKEKEMRQFPKGNNNPQKAPSRKGPKTPDEWKLKGAARPAALLARIEAGELNERGEEVHPVVEPYDLFEELETNKKFSVHEHGKEYLKILQQLAEACCEAGNNERGIEHYDRCMQLDISDQSKSREALVCALIDDGQGDKARELLDMKKQEEEESATMAYCRVILEYVSWEVLEEEGSSEEVVREAFLKAFKLNPFIAVFISAQEIFRQVVEYVDEIQELKPGSIEEAFVYGSRNIGVWIDTVGACAWIEKELQDLPEPTATEEDASDPMYFGMYETAIEMYKEELETLENTESDQEEQE